MSSNGEAFHYERPAAPGTDLGLPPPPPPLATSLPGTLVWLYVSPHAPGLSSKLLPKYGGPYRVAEWTSVNYVIKPFSHLLIPAAVDIISFT